MPNPNDRTILYTRDIHEQGPSVYIVYLLGDPHPLAVDEWEVEGGIVRFYLRGRSTTVAACPNHGWVAYHQDVLAATSIQEMRSQTQHLVDKLTAHLGIQTPEPPIKWAA